MSKYMVGAEKYPVRSRECVCIVLYVTSFHSHLFFERFMLCALLRRVLTFKKNVPEHF